MISFTSKEKKTFTFPITTLLDKTEEDFFNLLIEEYKGVSSAVVIKYTPYTSVSDDEIQDLNGFNSKLTFFNSKGENVGALEKNYNQTSKKNAIASKSSDCPPQFEALYAPCGCGGNADGHAPSGPPCCQGSPYIGYEITFNCSSGGGTPNEDTGSTWQDDLEQMNNLGQLGDLSGGGGLDGSGGSATSPIGIDNLVAIVDYYSQEFGILLSSNQSDFLLNNQQIDFEIRDFVLKNNKTDEAKNFAIQAIEAKVNNGEVDLDNRLIYNPIIAQDYKAKMSPAEITIFNTLTALQKQGYLKAATQAYIYAETHFPRPVQNTKGDTFKHTFWNALSTVYIGETLTKQLTDAHEDITYDSSYPNHYKETQMDLYNNSQGRQIAYDSGKLYQLVQNALDNGSLRYLNNLEFTGVF